MFYYMAEKKSLIWHFACEGGRAEFSSAKVCSFSCETSWISFRDKSTNNVATFTNRLANVNWDELSEYKDPDCTYWCFLDKYTTLYNDCFPLKKVKVKNVTLSKPWITKGLLRSVRKKNLLYKHFLAKPTSYRANLYKSYKNKLTHSLCVAKRL